MTSLKTRALNEMAAERKGRIGGPVCLLALGGLVSAMIVATAVAGPAWAQPEEEVRPPAEQANRATDRDDLRRGPGRRAPMNDSIEDRRALRRELREQMRNERRDRMEAGGGGGRGGERGPGGPPTMGEGRGPGRMGRYLDVVQSYQKAVQDPYQAIGLAVIGIKDYHRREGHALDAVKELEEILNSTHDQKIRNIVLFGMRQVYEEDRQSGKFNELNKRIIQENIAASGHTASSGSATSER